MKWTKRLVNILIVAISLIFFNAVRSFALDLISNDLQNKSAGQLGIVTRPSISNRHPGNEWYPAVIHQSGNPGVGFAWEIAEKWNGSGFFLFIHRKMPPNPDYELWLDPVSDGWHTLKIEQDPNSPEHWKLYFDDMVNYRAYLWWPYPANNVSRTRLECYEDLSNPYFFMGRHANIQIKKANGDWDYQGPAWYSSLLRKIDPHYPYWYYNYDYYDWESRTTRR